MERGATWTFGCLLQLFDERRYLQAESEAHREPELVKPAPFQYHAPASIEEGLDLLQRLEDAKPLAGGQSLVPLMNLRLAQPLHLVDLNTINSLNAVKYDEETFELGATVRHSEIEDSSELRHRNALLAHVAPHIGYREIRNRGTIGGSLCHADPASEWPAVVLALDAQLIAKSNDSTRTIAANEFFRGPFTTALEPHELLVSIRIPNVKGRWGFCEEARKVGDFAVAAAVVVLDREDDLCSFARIAVAGAGGRPLRCEQAEELLVGAVLTDMVVDAAAEAAASTISPSGDLHGSSEYRRRLVAVLVRRALHRALDVIPTISAGHDAG